VIEAAVEIILAFSYYNGLIKGRELERGIRLEMKVKLSAKLLVTPWTLMKRRETYNPSYFPG
jgi:hypothetical protein